MNNLITRGRIIQRINTGWKFIKGDASASWLKGFNDTDWKNITLPHDWSVEEPFNQAYSSGTGYLPGGTGWYRKSFTLPNEAYGKKVFINFDGAYKNAQVWCNSYYLGKHPYGYTSFTYDISDFVSFGNENNVITVKATHEDIADSRWFTGSGLYRNVCIIITDPIHIDKYGVFFTTKSVSLEQATTSVCVEVVNETSQETQIEIRNTLLTKDRQPVAAAGECLSITESSKSSYECSLVISHPNLWSPESPYLYTLLTEISRNGTVIDQMETLIGLRYFQFDSNKGFFLNGRNMKIKGVCLHHDAGCLGAAVPQKVWQRRLARLKEMGANAIRTSHNPPSAELLDLCDAMGFLVIDEAFDEWEGVKNKWSNGHNIYPPKYFGYYEDFPTWGETDIAEMVCRDRNHPSVIMWSIGNEVDYPNDPYCHPYFKTMTGNNDTNKPVAERQYDPNKPNTERLTTIAKKLVACVKSYDTSRPVTAALAFPELSNLTGYAEVLDIVGYNYKEHLYIEDHATYPDRVIYGSENNAGLASWLAVQNSDYISAQFIWTGIDYMGEAKGWPVRVSPSGFLDMAGFRKPKYYYRQSLWSDTPMVFLSVMKRDDANYERYTRWEGGSIHWDWDNGEPVTVLCYTNCEDVELVVNGDSQGSKKLRDFPKKFITWDLNFQKGSVLAIARQNGEELCRNELRSACIPMQIQMKTDTSSLLANGQDIAHIEIEILDANRTPVRTMDQDIQLYVKGAAMLLGLENGNGQDVTPYTSNVRKTHNGRLIAYIRAKETPGIACIKADSPKLTAEHITLEVL